MTNKELTEARELVKKLNLFLEENDNNDSDIPSDIINKLTVQVVENKSVYRGFYFNPELIKMLDAISSGKRNRGIKSDIINVALKEYLTNKGLYQDL